MDGEHIIDAEFRDIDENETSSKLINGEPLFFTTTQTALMVGVEASTIRFWTKRFESLFDIEVSNKHRRYKKSDIAKFKFIKKLAYDDGLTLQQIEDYCSSKGFDLDDIEKSIIDANNPIAIQAFISAATVEMDKKLNAFSEGLMERIGENLKNFLIIQGEMNDKLQENIVTTVDEVVSEKLESKFEEIKGLIDSIELEAKKRDEERLDALKESMKERERLTQELEKEKNRGLFKKLFGK